MYVCSTCTSYLKQRRQSIYHLLSIDQFYYSQSLRYPVCLSLCHFFLSLRACVSESFTLPFYKFQLDSISVSSLFQSRALSKHVYLHQCVYTDVQCMSICIIIVTVIISISLYLSLIHIYFFKLCHCKNKLLNSVNLLLFKYRKTEKKPSQNRRRNEMVSLL